MSVYAGPEIVQTNLVFAYDMGNIDKSWKGAPATNLISNPTNEVIATVNEFAIFADISPIFDTYGEGIYSISADIKSEVPGDITVYTASGAVEYNIGYYTAACETYYKRFYFNNINVTRTDPAVTYSNLSFYGGYGTGKKPSIKNVQIEKNAFCTPFVNGARSTTQALLDLTKNKTITTGSLTYNANNTFSFNGANNWMTIEQPAIGTSPNLWSIEFVVYPSGIDFIMISPESAGIDHFVSYDGNNKRINFQVTESADINNRARFSSTNSVPLNTYTHVVLTLNNLSMKIYVNGKLNSTYTETITIASWTGTWFIGQRQNSTYRMTGQLPLLNVYNRELTANEIRQNFNALRGRFGI